MVRQSAGEVEVAFCDLEYAADSIRDTDEPIEPGDIVTVADREYRVKEVRHPHGLIVEPYRRAWVDWLLIGLYLGAIVTANLVVARFGQVALPFTAFLLIPFDLVTRDVLHERWMDDRLWPKMLALIAAGSILATALNINAWRVAVASFLAFSVANGINAGVFHLLVGRTSRLVRMNASNLLAAIADSVIFPVVAFWPVVSVGLMGAQAGAKFVGGIFFSVIFVSIFDRKA